MTTCLIVDDSATVRRVIKQILSPLGYETIEAENGEKALQTVESVVPDIVLLDWNMPVMDGLEFLKRFRMKETTANTKVIFCTTMNDLPQIEQALDAGADEYIMKPFDEAIILEKFSQVGFC